MIHNFICTWKSLFKVILSNSFMWFWISTSIFSWLKIWITTKNRVEFLIIFLNSYINCLKKIFSQRHNKLDKCMTVFVFVLFKESLSLLHLENSWFQTCLWRTWVDTLQVCFQHFYPWKEFFSVGFIKITSFFRFHIDRNLHWIKINIFLF